MRLTGAQLELVKLVRRTPGVSVAQAAAELGLAANTVSTLVRRLTEEGMLVRTADPADRRIARLELPEALARRVGAYRDRRMVALGAAIATLEPDEQATIAAATALLARVADELERADGMSGSTLVDLSAGVADARTGDDRVPAVRARGLTHRFGDFTAVDGIDLTVAAGEVFGLLGPNGAGKTTTLRILNTLLPIQQGTAEVLGHDVSHDPMAVRRQLGYVPQQLSIEAALTGRENVSWFARLFDVPRRERRGRVADALDAMGLADAADRLAGTYSGGMVRRLELAQALVNRPALADSRRADRRPGSARARQRLGAGRRAVRADRDDRAADDALHGGGRRALRPDRADAPRHGPRRGLAGRAQGRARRRTRRSRTSSATTPVARSPVTPTQGGLRAIRSTRRTARRVG